MNGKFTIFTSPYKIGKKINLKDGVLTKVNVAYSSGISQTVDFVSAEAFAEVLETITTKQALCSGISKYSGEQHVVPQNQAKSGDLTRTKSVFPHQGPGVLVWDYDGKEITKQEFLAIVHKVIPEVQGYVHWSSSSSYLMDGDVPLSGLKGQRVYILVEDTTDLPRVFEEIHNRLWLHGFGHIMVTSCGRLLPKSPIDQAMKTSNQLDYAGGALCTDPVFQNRPAPEAFGEGFLDTRSKILDLTIDGRTQVEKAINAAKLKLADKSLITRRKWIAAAVSDIEDADKKAEARKRYETALDDGLLHADFKIYLEEGKSVRVADILVNPKKYHGKVCLDPFEPEYQDYKPVAKIYTLNQGRACINSFAHGGDRYTLRAHTHTIRVEPGSLDIMIDKAILNLADNPQIYKQGDNLIEVTDNRLRPICKEALTVILSASVSFVKFNQKAGRDTPINPPADICQGILSRPTLWGPIKALTAVVQRPMLKKNGQVINGYDADTGILNTADDWSICLPDTVTEKQLQKAYETFTFPISEFPFASPIDKTNAVSAMMVGCVRALLPTVPGVIVSGPVANTGKTLLAMMFGQILTQRRQSLIPYNSNYGEMDKTIDTNLLTGAAFIGIDNWPNGKRVKGDRMAAYITAEAITLRTLGKSQNTEVPNKSLFVISGNQIVADGDNVHRFLKIQLDSKSEKPLTIKHTFHPLDWLDLHYREFYEAGLLLMKHCNKPNVITGSKFPGFDSTIGSNIRALGIYGWTDLEDPNAYLIKQANEDTTMDILSGYLKILYAHYKDTSFTSGDLIEAGIEGIPQMKQQGCGQWLRVRCDQRVDGLYLSKVMPGTKKQGAKYAIKIY